MKKLIIIPLVLVILSSCKKDKDKNCDLNMTSVAGSYKITAVKYKATPSSPETDYYNIIFPDACEHDDIVTLNANGSYVFTDAGVKCVPPGDDTGTWSLSGNTATIDTEIFNVDNFNCSSLTISITDVNIVGDKQILVLTRQ